MSDVTPVAVPDAGWYADRTDADFVRWWDGRQWTDHTRSIAPEQNTAQPLPAAASGFAPVEPNPLAAVGAPAAGWYPDHADPSIQRWWDGAQWTSHTAPGVALPTLNPTPGSYLGAYTMPLWPATNTLATRGMVYSLISLVLNPLLIMSIGGLVNGIRAMRRVPQFAPENARRGQAIAAIAVGSVATVLSIFLVAVAIVFPLIEHQSNGLHDGTSTSTTTAPSDDALAGLEQQIAADAQSRFGSPVSDIRCDDSAKVTPNWAFPCNVILQDSRMEVVNVAIDNNDAPSFEWLTSNDAPTDPGTTA